MKILLTAIMLVLPDVAIAQQQEFSEARIVADCTRDALKFCRPVIEQGRFAIIECMKANRANLQAKCQRHIRP